MIDYEQDFAGLLNAARSGSEIALKRLTEDCRPYLLVVARQQLDSDLQRKVSASDVVQESLISMHRELDNFQGKTSRELLSWLRGFVINDIKEIRRSFKTEKRKLSREKSLARLLVEPASWKEFTITPSTDASLREQAVLLRSALQQLPEEKRLVIRLRTWDGLSFQQIGEEMGRSAEAARKLWARSIRQLASLLAILASD